MGLALVFGVVGGLALLAVLGGPADPRSGRALVAAHRGGGLLWPENSLLAFKNAIALGADLLELDVHLSKDGELVVIHDPTLERTTTGTGAVRDRTLGELRSLRLKDKDGKVMDEPIPTLGEVLELAALARLQLLVDIKADHRRERYPGIEEKVLAILDRYHAIPRSIVMAFEQATVRRVRELRPEVRAGALYSPARLAMAGSSIDRELAALPGMGVHFVGLHQELVTEEIANQVKQAGLSFGVWTVNEADAMRRFLALGADILITDRPDLARELLKR
ncbi:MAG: glycerophosphodiester phosphodiesterase [Candidatus Rokubacteria bacterium]|nr:glycerophosphodiester phosphodiesterase [Candidatus Rokubacteria bacterium]